MIFFNSSIFYFADLRSGALTSPEIFIFVLNRKISKDGQK